MDMFYIDLLGVVIYGLGVVGFGCVRWSFRNFWFVFLVYVVEFCEFMLFCGIIFGCFVLVVL